MNEQEKKSTKPNNNEPNAESPQESSEARETTNAEGVTEDRKSLEAEQQAAYYKDQYLRKAAEYDNLRRRTEIEKQQIVLYSNERLATHILPVLDDFERSLKSVPERVKDDSFAQGVELIYKKLLKVLADVGVKPFESTGKHFDVHFHDALMQIPRDDVPPETIVEEVSRGYMYHDRVLRHAKVVVAVAPPKGEEAAKERGA